MRPIDLRLVLTRSIYERNVGATARAMSNMGFNKLILVDPKCEFTIEANKAAAKIPMIEATTINSISVKPLLKCTLTKKRPIYTL